MAQKLYNVAKSSFDDYKNKLENKKYRLIEVAENIEVQDAKLISLYVLSAMENSTSQMSDILKLLEALHNEEITPPSLIISGLESEGTANFDVPVTKGENTITFPITLSSSDYALFITSYTSDGNFNSYKRYDKTASGFKIAVAQDGYIDYRAILT